MSSTYVALLRGINVGGNNIIKMADLRAHLTDVGLGDVRTYIQSGNVVFTAADTDAASLAEVVERELHRRFGSSARVAVITAADLESIVAEAPAGFGDEPDAYRYDVLFVLATTTPEIVLDTIRELPPRDGVDDVWAGSRAVYFRRRSAQASKSRFPKLVSTPVYAHVTIRNWNTTTKLLSMATES